MGKFISAALTYLLMFLAMALLAYVFLDGLERQEFVDQAARARRHAEIVSNRPDLPAAPVLAPGDPATIPPAVPRNLRRAK